MAEIFEYVPHHHHETRHQQGPPTTAQARSEVHGTSRMQQLNAKVGLRITVIVGTMWAAYLFTVLTLVSLPGAINTHNTVVIVAWIAQTFLQLVLLPIIIVGQNIQAQAADNRSQATFDDATAILEESKSIQQHLLAQDRAIADLLEQVNALRK